MTEYKSFENKIGKRTIGEALFAEKPSLVVVSKLSDELKEEYAKIIFLQFRRYINCFKQDEVERLLPVLKENSSIELIGMNKYVNMNPFMVSNETKFKDQINIYNERKLKATESLRNTLIIWLDNFKHVRNTNFIKSLRFNDWLDGIDLSTVPLLSKNTLVEIERNYLQEEILDVYNNLLNSYDKRIVRLFNLFTHLLFKTGNENLCKVLINSFESKDLTISEEKAIFMKQIDNLIYKFPNLKKIAEEILNKKEELSNTNVVEDCDNAFSIYVNIDALQQQYVRAVKKDGIVQNIKSYLTKLSESVYSGEKTIYNHIVNISYIPQNKESINSESKIVITVILPNDFLSVKKEIKQLFKDEVIYIFSKEAKVVSIERAKEQTNQLYNLIEKYEMEKIIDNSNIKPKKIKF